MNIYLSYNKFIFWQTIIKTSIKVYKIILVNFNNYYVFVILFKINELNAKVIRNEFNKLRKYK